MSTTKRKDSRQKGQRGERELFAELSALLGFEVRRNAAPAARKGEPDSHELPYFAPEVKRAEKWVEAYWEQAVRQANSQLLMPVLFFRRSHQPWSAFVEGGVVSQHLIGERVQLTLPQFAKVWQSINRSRAS